MSDKRWLKYLRALPSPAASQDVLKPDYIDVNLNNSRKLIMNVGRVNEVSEGAVEGLTQVNEGLMRVAEVRGVLQWTEYLTKGTSQNR